MSSASATLLAVTVMTFTVTFDGAAVQMILPVLEKELGGGIASVQWIMTSFLALSTAGLIPAGRAGDLFGRAKMWRLGALIFLGASVGCAASPSLWWLVGARAAQGVGSALVAANSPPLVVSAFREQRRGMALGITNIGIALGLVFGPSVGAVATQYLSWRWIFILAVPIAITSLLRARGALPDSERRREAVDLVGALLALTTLTVLLVAASFGDRWGWASIRVLILFGLSAVGLSVFVWWERATKRPMLDLGLFRRRMFTTGAAAAALAYSSLFALTVTMPFFLFRAQQRSLVEAGLLVAIVPAGLSVVAPWAGWVAQRTGARIISTLGLAGVLGALLLLQWAGPDGGGGVVGVALALTGAGLGAFEAPNNVAVLGSLHDEELSIGNATLNTLRNLGMTLGVSGAAILLDVGVRHSDASSASLRAAEGVHLALLIAAGFAAAGTAVSALRPGAAAQRAQRHG